MFKLGKLCLLLHQNSQIFVHGAAMIFQNISSMAICFFEQKVFHTTQGQYFTPHKFNISVFGTKSTYFTPHKFSISVFFLFRKIFHTTQVQYFCWRINPLFPTSATIVGPTMLVNRGVLFWCKTNRASRLNALEDI